MSKCFDLKCITGLEERIIAPRLFDKLFGKLFGRYVVQIITIEAINISQYNNNLMVLCFSDTS